MNAPHLVCCSITDVYRPAYHGEHDPAGEATVRDAYRERLRNDISAEEADDDAAEREANGAHDYDDLDEIDIDTQRQGWWL